jgi:hypothetical protein
MKVKELVAMLQKMDPEMDLTMYIGGEEWYHDFELTGVELYYEECATIHFILDKTEGWKIHEELQVKTFCEQCENMGFTVCDLEYEQQVEMYNTLQEGLANCDCYNEDYAQALRDIMYDYELEDEV